MPGSSHNDLAPDIEILNFNESEIVKHTLLLLKARLTKNTSYQHDLLINFTPHTAIEYLITPISQRGVFKILLNLSQLFADNSTEQGTFNLQLQCGAATKTVNIKYANTAKSCNYKVQPLYILCADHAVEEQVQQQQRAIIDLNLKIVQCVYADRLSASGLGRATFQINAECLTLRVRLSRAQLWQLTPQEIWQHVASDLLNCSLNQPNIKFVAFIASTQYNAECVKVLNYEHMRQLLQGHVALGAGGLALFSVAYFYAWPQQFKQILKSFNNSQSVDWQQLPDESNFRRTFAGVYASTLGAVCHELGHVFDLGHTEQGVMGAGLDYLNRLFTVDTPTEALPPRQVDVPKDMTTTSRQRLTKIKPHNSNNFLNKYRSQQIADEQDFYFTRNCALMLSAHKWLSGESAKCSEEFSVVVEENVIKLSCAVQVKLIEVRKNENGFVLWFHEFRVGEQLMRSFELPNTAGFECKRTHLIIMTCSGDIKRIEWITNQI